MACYFSNNLFHLLVDQKGPFCYNVCIVINKEREMKDLIRYVEQKNAWYQLFDKKPNYLDLDKPADRQRIANIIDSELSPENLTCDGELSIAQVRARRAVLVAVAKELQRFDPTVKFYEFN
jgi:hypothetical protein